MAAYHLMRRAQAAEAERNGKGSHTWRTDKKTAKDWLEEDEALLSGQTPEAAKSQAAAPKRPLADDVSIRLSDLIGRLKDLQAHPEAAASSHSETSIQYSKVETEISLEYHALAPVEGLVRRDKNTAETDRYQFDFVDGGTFKITDKWSDKSTTIWGDPHVDVSDVDGNRDGEFSDLKSSDSQTTLELQDGTRVTFTARDNGVIEAVDIFKGNQHLRGVGAGAQEWSDETGLFAAGVQADGQSASSQVPLGDVVRAGGDGNDWFDLAGRQVWGKTTGPVVTARPAYTLQITMQQTVTQAAFTQTIDRQF
jgi:hypothetical protein